MNRRGAFTLIELLVSVAIIALLISIALPTISEARRVSRKTQCQHNLHQIGVGLQTYFQMNRDKFPTLTRLQSIESVVAPTLGIGPRPSMGKGLTREFGKNSKVLECPSDVVTEISESDRPMIAAAGSKLRVGARYFDSEDSSYDWTTQVNGLHRHEKTIILFGSSVPVPLLSVPIVFDFEAFHGGKNRRGSINNLYADLRVEASK